MNALLITWPVTEKESMLLTDTNAVINIGRSQAVANQGLIDAKCGVSPKENRYAYIICKVYRTYEDGNKEWPVQYLLALNIRINGMNGAIIGRRKGPYTQFFENQSYVSGVHAQLKFNPGVGWCVVDKHSSNGTLLNQRPIQPDVDMTLNSGDILTIANVNLQVIIS